MFSALTWTHLEWCNALYRENNNWSLSSSLFYQINQKHQIISMQPCLQYIWSSKNKTNKHTKKQNQQQNKIQNQRKHKTKQNIKQNKTKHEVCTIGWHCLINLHLYVNARIFHWFLKMKIKTHFKPWCRSEMEVVMF